MIDRYSRPIMKKIWSEETKFSSMLEVEKAAAYAFCKLGVIPQDDYKKIEDSASFSVSRIHEIEEITKHDVIAFTRCVSESLGEERKWIHYGLTSTDVVDTALAVILKDCSQLIIAGVKSIILELRDKALTYKTTPCIGRTHGIHAEITSFGLKWARWYAEMERNLQRFISASERICVGKISGAVGNFANTPIEVEEIVCDKLGLKCADISTQVLPRDLHIEYIQSLAMIATTLEEIAIEIRSLSRTEIHEVEEYFAKGQKGSSAMPHKRNPISSENICGCARIVRSYITVAHENNLLWHERDISHSSAERIMLADATTLVDYMIHRYSKVIHNLNILEGRMLKNINLTYGVIFSGRVVSALINSGLSRETSYDLVQPLTMKAWDEGIMFIDLLKENEEILKHLTPSEIEECFTLDFYMKSIDKIYKRLRIEENTYE